MTQPPHPQPQSQSQPQDGNPYAQQPPQPGAPQQPYAPFPQQQAQPGGFAPLPAQGGRGGKAALGIVAAVVLALVTAWIYGAVMKATEHEIGYAAVAVGAVIGFAAGKLGGRNPVLPAVCALLAIAAVYLGQLTGYAMAIGEYADMSFLDVLFQHFRDLNAAWKQEADIKTWLFLAVGGFAAFGAAKRAAA
ncbi:hypothetical protein [Streptomyces sp. NPDC049813]|uniref:hypothetical protein n=1 Tax=Streptomyces sp. NPDC049813 TaxID=3365597 RepID=UPI0037BC9870